MVSGEGRMDVHAADSTYARCSRICWGGERVTATCCGAMVYAVGSGDACGIAATSSIGGCAYLQYETTPRPFSWGRWIKLQEEKGQEDTHSGIRAALGSRPGGLPSWRFGFSFSSSAAADASSSSDSVAPQRWGAVRLCC